MLFSLGSLRKTHENCFICQLLNRLKLYSDHPQPYIRTYGYPHVRDARMTDAGRKAKFNADDYISAVKKTKSLNDKDIAKAIGVDRSRINRFRNSNPDIVIEAENILKSFNSVRYDSMTIDMFKNIPVIDEWLDIMINKPLAQITMNKRLRALYNVCTYLKIHPDKLTVDIASDFAKKMKQLGKEHPSGLGYYEIRKPLRNFFQYMHGISGELLNIKGIEAGRTEGDGRFATAKILKDQRKTIEETMWIGINEEKDYLSKIDYTPEMAYDEMMGICHFMYYSATRKQGTSFAHFGDSRHLIEDGYLEIHLVDKGEGGGEHWNKRFVDDGYKKMEEYFERRFNIQSMDEILKRKGVMFPLIRGDRYKHECKYMRIAQETAGCVIHQPNHIWRHTFAQDCLYATNYNYELTAAIGGWKTTEVLKLHYGKMGSNIVKDGLKEAMGIPVKREIRYLRW